MKKESREQKGREDFSSNALLPIAVLAGICIFAILLFYSSMDKRLYEDRSSHLNEITEKTAHTVDLVISEYLKFSNQIVLHIDTTSTESEETLMERLTQIQTNLLPDEVGTLIVDEEGKYLCMDGKTGILEEWNTDSKNEQVLIRQIEEKTSMLFLVPLKQPIVLSQGEKAVYIGLSRDMETFQEIFGESEFTSECEIYLTDREGNAFYGWGPDDNVKTENLLQKKLEGKNFLHNGTAEEVRQNLREGIPGSVEFATGERKYFLACAPVYSDKWSLMLFVPTDVLSTNTEALMNFTTIAMGLIAVALIALLSFAVVYSNSFHDSKQKLKHREAENLVLEQAIKEADEASAAKRRFLSQISQDIRTPINGIIDMTDIALKNMEDPDRIRDCLGKVSSSCAQMLALINDVMAINRLESGKGIITKTPMDIHRVLQDCADSVKNKVEKKKMVFTVQDENILHSYLLGDKERLCRILDNILDNAIKVTPQEGIVSFRATEIESNEKIAVIRFEIQDNGIGISEEFQKYLFHELDMMGGDIQIDSKLQKGTTFIVTLSFDIDNIEKTEETDKKDSDLAGMKILLAEDNELNMEIIQYELEELGASVVCASHGQAAVDIFAKSAEQTFDAILMDVMMPVMDGIRAAELIRGFDRKDAEKIPIIAMTASICTEDIKGFQKAGIQAYLEKPIEPAALYEILAPYKRGMEYEN